MNSPSSDLSYFNRPSVQKLLDTSASTIADEYIEKANKIRNIFRRNWR